MFNLEADTMLPILERLFNKLKDLQKTIATAESCTGGLLASLLTHLPGSSQYYLGGVTAYANTAKKDLLKVPASLIEERGAVSAEVAAAMADGARKIFNSSYALAVTGIAGPSSSGSSKPVGTIWCGFAGPAGLDSKLLQLRGDRTTIRAMTSKLALEEFYSYIENH